MKNLSLTTLLIIITLGLSSCTQDDNTILQEPTAEDMLKSFNLNKSKNGEFSLNYELGNGVSSDNVLDEKTNTNNIYLYSADNQRRSSSEAQDLAIQNGQLSVNFNDTEKDQNHRITILDNDIQMKSGGNEFLESYEVSGNEDGTYDLGFKVAEGVAVDFIYDDDNKVYEIHLNADENASQSEFLQSFTKEEGVAINIHFFDNSNSLQRSGDGSGTEPTPSIIIEKDEVDD